MARPYSVSQTDNKTQVGSISAASEVVGPFRYRKGSADREINQVHLIISGTWVGTMLLQTSIPDVGQWVTVDGGTFTANTSESMTLGGSVDARLYCSAYTSGTCYAAFSNV